jgi:hypothetical protein
MAAARGEGVRIDARFMGMCGPEWADFGLRVSVYILFFICILGILVWTAEGSDWFVPVAVVRG